MNVSRPELIHRWNHKYSILSVVSFPSKKLLFAGTQDSKILVFHLPTYNLIKTIQLGNSTETNTRSSVLCMTRSNDERHLFSAGADSLVRIWSVDNNSMKNLINVEELATIYSVTDIGDIFSITYLDLLDTIVFGCQNASLLYLDNIFLRIHAMNSNEEIDLNRLPHRRYDKFFDSFGPTGSGAASSSSLDLSPTSQTINLVTTNTTNLKITNNTILEIPSENIIKYAHNGFIYSICKMCSSFNCHFNQDYPVPSSMESGDECKYGYIISSGGDGVSKTWKFEKIQGNGSIKVSLIDEDMDNEDSVLSQTIEFPFLYCGLSDGIINIWDLNTKQLISTLNTTDKSDIISLSVFNDHIFAVDKSGITLFFENQIHHWNPNQGNLLTSEIFERETKGQESLPSLLTGGNDGSLTLWDISHLFSQRITPMKTVTSGDAYGFTAQAVPSRFERTASWVTYQPAMVNSEEMLKTLRELISYQTVSQTHDTQQQLQTRRCATYLQQLLRNFGAADSRLFPVSNGANPVVFAHFKGKGNSETGEKKRILWYGHFDVIPAGDTEKWNTNPFHLTCENGYLKGRGVSDNKGPLVSAIHSVASLFQEDKLINDVVFLIEGNEEIGSPGFSEVCQKYRNIIGEKIDWILMSNSSWVDQEHPCLNYGLRGVINAQVSIWGDEPDRHSGVDGGVHREPTTDLINVISKLQSEDGRIQIPNFYLPLKELSATDYAMFQEIMKEANIDKKITIEELIINWTKPSLSITTLKMSGPGNITVIPKSASIGLSIRLVPEQSVEQVKKDLTEYIKQTFAKLPTKNHIEVTILNEAEAWLGDPTNHAYQILKEEVTAAWDMEPLFVREGGSIPCIRDLERIFDAQAVQIPCGQSTDNAHLNNENLRIKNWTKLAEILTNVFNRL
ncbi:glutamine amidotransferase subunit DUG2 NDAI_0B04880 [Naumovozyma dairenensis CBS 421]|uniref:Peptidase M20 dimerisation domain-containing protein n=1 Tax=Naumovozyma dairenensis (strain ATCC 10597 / BCRC 20456 / CBS 421 / NBRC 0211 / NRRL Y-12639) TaxID=1071378 RepID=G0W6W1_NAUDC|nr:hypothetical protein NDAI_0B04880 [Naumovozyma dairenensis CBS 421]CCD23522.1 hypothetical protein NDAI_0B04880 [Naumovozyma dairenensis CBS 421]